MKHENAEVQKGLVVQHTDSNLQADCLIAKADGPGQVDLLIIFGKCWPPHVYIYTSLDPVHEMHGCEHDLDRLWI